MICTTLNRIREHSPCAEGWRKLLAHLGKTQADDEPLSFATILQSNGLDDALWCCRVEPQHSKVWRLFAVRCARRVQHMMTDSRTVAAMDVAERHANGLATDDELDVACASAWDAARDEASGAAWGAARASARAVARDAVSVAAWAAARDKAWDKASGAAWGAARASAWAAARDKAWDKAWAEMTADFLQAVSEA